MLNTKLRWIYLPAALLLLSAIGACGAERVQCGQVKGRHIAGPVGYCAMLPPSYDASPARKFPVLYFLHGLGGDQTFLVSSGGWQIIEDLWEQKKIGEFVIITPQAGNSFYINSKDGTVKYEDFFIRDFVPQMEKKFRLAGTRNGRAIGGVSMGGYGALRFAFKYPQMFISVAAEMPALLQQLPRGANNAGFTEFFGTAFGSPADEAFWKANTPFVYARKSYLQGLKIYAVCGDRDNYGFDAGTRQLDRLLTNRNVPHSIHIYPGQHDWQFAARHLEESLEFQSKAFGLKQER
ncbi:MAG TPA: alpha/beta hydrolase family protein [Candidatus Limnocylindrales bacterium]|nr:alpha/beta hydrolase family protein [Candidatus Limnocylindrales bacterium]